MEKSILERVKAGLNENSPEADDLLFRPEAIDPEWCDVPRTIDPSPYPEYTDYFAFIGDGPLRNGPGYEDCWLFFQGDVTADDRLDPEDECAEFAAIFNALIDGRIQEAHDILKAYRERIAGCYYTISVLPSQFNEVFGSQAERLNNPAIIDFATNLILHSSSLTDVKFALDTIALFETCDNSELRDAVSALAMADELTLHCLPIVKRWDNANDIVFEIAQHTYGFGRALAIELLEADTDEIKQWLLTEGIKNVAMPHSHSAMCFEKGGLADILSGELIPEDQFNTWLYEYTFMAFGWPDESDFSMDYYYDFQILTHPEAMALAFIKQLEMHDELDIRETNFLDSLKRHYVLGDQQDDAGDEE